MNFYNNKNILVTGGSGFIGSHIVEKLVELEANVTVLDNLSSGNLNNLSAVKDKVKFINGDINNLELCIKVGQNQNVIFHLAAFISVPESMLRPEQCSQTNVNGTLNLLESCRINNISKFIFSSSSAVYGPRNNECHEDDICNPTSVYGYSKYIGEQYCKMYSVLYNLQTICLRYFNVYGERQNPNGAYAAVVAKFKNQMLNNQPIEIFGNGLQTRDFIHVSKIVDANLKLATLDCDFLNGQPVNVATGHSITLLSLIETLKKEFNNFNGDILFKPARSGDIEHSKASCNKINKLLGLV